MAGIPSGAGRNVEVQREWLKYPLEWVGLVRSPLGCRRIGWNILRNGWDWSVCPRDYSLFSRGWSTQARLPLVLKEQTALIRMSYWDWTHFLWSRAELVRILLYTFTSKCHGIKVVQAHKALHQWFLKSASSNTSCLI